MSHPNDNHTCYYNNQHFITSGQIESLAKHQYGYFEIFVKLPTFDGYWPAFWLYGQNSTFQDSWYNEIDIFEGNGSDISHMSCNYWYNDTFPVTPRETHVHNYSCYYANSYHWFGVKWDKTNITWYYDRNPVKSVLNDFGGVGIIHPLTIFINSALFPDGWSNPVSNQTIFPNYMYVDQINIYHLNCQDKEVDVFEINNFNTYNYLVKKSITLSGNTTLPYNANIPLYARDYIELTNGFEVNLGTELYLEICDGCQ